MATDPNSTNGDARRRRSRSLSRYSGRFPPPPPVSDESQTQTNAGFPEISLDDLADELFRRTEGEDEESRSEIGRSRRRDSELGYRAETVSSRRRGRSVSKSREPAGGERKGFLESNGESKGVSGGRPRRQRSVSVARGRERGVEVMVKTERMVTVNAKDSHSTSSNSVQNTAELRKSYTTKLEQSQKQRQDLLAKLAVEDQRGQKLTKIVSKLLPAPKQTVKTDRPTRSTRRRSDKIGMAKHLDEEAEKIFKDFLSSIEDTDISSYDGERSETSSMIGGSAEARHTVTHNSVEETWGSLDNIAPAPVKADGVVLPWLQWETKFPSPSKSKMGVQMPSGSDLFNTSEDVSSAYYNSNCLASSRGSWSPEANGSCSAFSPDTASCRIREVESGISVHSAGRPYRSSFDMDEYVDLQLQEELLFEKVRQRQRIDTGSLILCGRSLI